MTTMGMAALPLHLPARPMAGSATPLMTTCSQVPSAIRNLLLVTTQSAHLGQGPCSRSGEVTGAAAAQAVQD
ncbi:hypothetical protein E2562_031937 [Oryza meyeriana var. granulata]|uniref:Uncharacterized protein n=1 Tax=Oryza meyeriana var. granulata TaxID=110450 RepID=A0A6G1F096_9ORYZ|nr:hypothetical protein E2562_031937 [Oryza meyeriana var. granulata]